MSSSNSSAATAEIDAVRRGAAIFVQVWCYFLFCFGIVGHVLSIYVFTRRSLYSNPCSRYLLASTLSGLVVVGMNIPLRFFQAVYRLDIFMYSDATCRIFTWLLVWARALTPWFLVVACIDRFLCSSLSAGVRAWSNLRVASRTIPLVVVIVGLAYVHVMYYAERNFPLLRCDAQLGVYLTFYGIWNLIIFGVSPSIFMFIFGLLTIRHVRQAMRRVLPKNTHILARNELESQAQHHQKATDRQLLQMLLAQCIVFCLTAAPSAVNYIYFSVISTTTLTALQIAQNNLAGNVVNYLSLTGPSLSFYMFTLSSQLFRRELKYLFRCRLQAIQITTGTGISLSRRN